MSERMPGRRAPFDASSPFPVMQVDRSGSIARANPAAQAAFGLSPESPGLLSEVLPDAGRLNVPDCIASGAERVFCARIGGRRWQLTLIGHPGQGAGQIYAHDISPYEDMTREMAQIREAHQRQQKELMCVYGLAEAICVRETAQEICRDVVRLLPGAWRYPEYARGRIVLDGEEYLSQPFEMTRWGQSAVIMAEGAARGMVQVFYTRDCRHSGEEGPFLPEERQLLDAVARTLGEAIARRGAEADNRAKALILAQERNRLETILNSMGEGVVVTDSRTRVVMMNPAMGALLGLAPETCAGKDFLALMPDKAFRAVWRKTGADQGDFAKERVILGHPEPRMCWATRSCIHNMGAGETWHVTIFQDVTRELEIDQMKSDFVAAVSHELRTPMTSIKGFVKTLLGKPNVKPELRERFLTIMDEEADRLIMLIEELLLIARIESGKVMLERGPVALDELAQCAVATLTHVAEGKKLRLTIHTENPLPRVYGDAKRLHTVLHNLVENAIKFTPEGGWVRGRIFGQGAGVVIEVADNGVGIPKEAQGRIFDRFYRVHREGEVVSGTGLGLFIVREMVRLHDGRVEVESEPGQGSTFRVYVPAGAGAASE